MSSHKIDYKKVSISPSNKAKSRKTPSQLMAKMCSKYPKIPHTVEAKSKTIVFGDIHGDMRLAIKLLCLAEAISVDKKGKITWKGKNMVIVQVGDQVDRCRPMAPGDCENPKYTKDDENSDLKILKLFSKLNVQAKKYNSMVISLLGNHEINNINGRMSYVSYEGIVGFKDEVNPKTGKRIADEQGFEGTDFEIGKQVRTYLFERGNGIAKMLACTRQSIVRVGNYLFVHASVLQKFAETFPGDDGLKLANDSIRQWILNLLSSNSIIEGTDVKIKEILADMEISLFWPRNLNALPNSSTMSDEECESQLGNIFKAYNIHGIVVGHTVQSKHGGINLKCTGTLDNGLKTFVGLVDTGASHAFDHFSFHKESLPEILIIENNGEAVYKKNKNGKTKLL